MTATTTANDDSDEAQNDGFNVAEEVDFQTWVDFSYDEVGEYVHLIPDTENREIRCYRSIDPSGEGNRRLKTTIENVRFSYHFDNEESEVNGFYLTWMEAKSFMTFLDLLSRGQEHHVNVNWWEDSGKKMHEETRTKEETINLKFTKPNGTERSIQIASTWQTPGHKMAKLEGDSR